MKKIVLILLFASSASAAQTLIRSEPIVGGALCHYSDGSVIRKSGDSYCQRNKQRQEARRGNRANQQNQQNNNRRYLIRIEPIVGGARCYYSDGSVTRKRGDSNCPRR